MESEFWMLEGTLGIFLEVISSVMSELCFRIIEIISRYACQQEGDGVGK